MRFLYWTIAILILLILGFSITTAIYVDKYLEEYVGKILREESINIRGNRYRVSATAIQTDIFQGNIELTQVSISPSALISDTLKEPAIGFLKASNLRIEGFDLQSYYFNRNLEFKKILIEDPVMAAYFRETGTEKIPAPLLDKIKVKAPQIFVDSIFIKNGNANLYDINNGDTLKFFSIDQYSSSYGSFRLDSFSLENRYPFSFGFARIEGRGLNIRMSPYQNLSVDTFFWSTIDSSFSLHQVQVEPKITPEKFSSELQFQDDWFAVDVDRIEMAPFNPKFYLDNEILKFETVYVHHPKAYFYRDITLPREDLERMLPATAISNVPWETHVEKIHMKHGDITYRERFDEDHAPLEVNISDMSFDTGPLRSSDPNGFSWNIKAKLFGEIPVEGKVNFSIMDGMEYFEATGKSKEIEFQKLNDLVSKLAPVEFKSGKIRSLKFSLRADEDTCSGLLDMEYENMKLMINKSKGGEIRSNNLLSFAANTFKKSNNLKGKDNYKTGKILARRDKRKSFFHYFWRSLESGVLSSFSTASYDRKQRKMVLSQ